MTSERALRSQMQPLDAAASSQSLQLNLETGRLELWLKSLCRAALRDEGVTGRLAGGVSHSAGGGRWLIQSLAAASRTADAASPPCPQDSQVRGRGARSCAACRPQAWMSGAHRARESARVRGNSRSPPNIPKIHSFASPIRYFLSTPAWQLLTST